jgi:FkbM family methyltransferase
VEGNECYKFSTIRRYIAQTGAPPVRLAIDVGANVGAVTRLLKAYFPSARVYAFEAVREYFEVARARTANLADVHVYHRVITSQHLYHDDFGREPRLGRERLHIFKATPNAGAGWRGGSMVIPEDKVRDRPASPKYESYPAQARVCTLDRLIQVTLRIQKAVEVDVLKMDCEGCEHSGLGSASESSLQSVRYIVGEYHGIQRFFRVMQERLFHTHKVSLIGGRHLGAFFAERRDGTRDGILLDNNNGMLKPRPWLAAVPLEWHLFNKRFVAPEERRSHAL